MAMIDRLVAHALVVVTLTHTARWVTMEVEPELAVLDEAQRWQDEVECLVRHQLTTRPLVVAAVHNTDSSLDLAVIIAEVLDVHRDDLALVLQGHDGATVIRLEVAHDVEAAYLTVTLRHDR